MGKHLKKYYFLYIAIILYLISLILISDEMVKWISLKDELEYSFGHNLTFVFKYIAESLCAPLLFLTIYFGIKCNRLSKIADVGSKEAFDEFKKNRKLERLRKKQQKLEKEISDISKK